eukprot:CAMPEP_0172505338 /NCGR_PEP_ID=MMETSP1066-20121228/185578_1 /TAXON_ID=671091 /ORGANISM="Coscinodiscus wailesii, Strain CCMP2513" /LENGTH=493 /DNA_ID=CAMNT_0013281907 /DNA_START=44 /DNA_END=1522 /DNA_ORIENTATION=+
MDTDLVSSCSASYPSAEDELERLQCVVDGIRNEHRGVSAGLDAFFLIFASSLMFFMQGGFAMLCAGCVRKKNVQNTLLKNLLDACGAAIGFWSVGYAFAYGGTSTSRGVTFIGSSNFFMMGVENYSFWLFQFAFAATSATIVAGTLAERSQMMAYMCYSLVLTGFVYPVVAHAVWSYNGFLSWRAREPLWGIGMIDFAGSAVVHLTGGMTAIIATKILGPRKDRFHDEDGGVMETPSKIVGHSTSLQVLGTFILWFGWYGFNAGSTLHINTEVTARVASVAAVSTALASAAGSVSSLFLSVFLTERRTGEMIYDVSMALNGCLSGLVSITGGCSVVEPWAAVVIGLVSGINYVFFSELLIKLKIDDVVDAIPVHLPNGIWGAVAVGLFASPRRLLDAYGQNKHVGFFYSLGSGGIDARILGTNLVGIVFVIAWVSLTMGPFFILLNYAGWLRADALEEIVGLDISYHGVQEYNGTAVKSELVEMIESMKNSDS